MDLYSRIGPVVLHRVQTVQAEAGEGGGGKDVLGDGGGEEGEAGRLGHWTAVRGTGKAWVGVALNKSEGPCREKTKKQDFISVQR